MMLLRVIGAIALLSPFAHGYLMWTKACDADNIAIYDFDCNLPSYEEAMRYGSYLEDTFGCAHTGPTALHCFGMTGEQLKEICVSRGQAQPAFQPGVQC